MQDHLLSTNSHEITLFNIEQETFSTWCSALMTHLVKRFSFTQVVSGRQANRADQFKPINQNMSLKAINTVSEPQLCDYYIPNPMYAIQSQ